MLVVDSKTMKKIDQYAIDVLKVPSICLVERAALAVIKNINLEKRTSFAIVVGVGNNGADGLAIARNLLAMGKYVEIYIVGDLTKQSQDFKLNLDSCKRLTDKIFEPKSIEDLAIMERNLEEVSTIIDAIFGTGLNRTVGGMQSYMISLINRTMKYTISVDIPSGLDGDSGRNWGEVVDSDLIISMQIMKRGVYEKSHFKDKCIVEDIGIPQKAIRAIL
ncbi:Nicotinamide nucleotide repair protein [Anaerococcus prevotii]|uniref:NAD(P)H-hydrate epimerase n=1 Tax=Anaerococcus prevotii (strain ATCC 9321 / DSM 20548 / JCM 6508 / NCTC 11806 / PC1) TaxID=525919 RepID=NNRE_ANAPD|nr:NAD(P)H-hydrate epimerase [Anaerococcus prevotii]C7RGH4.1 RecName: Full=NAD(P)H-hydrate epimerase; AltName: Full=NAD(P)HX epimerase [Anaerococcus prevotii DSM 20548]ACV28585.1 carbohydrate kinase, YjeF related protein [Anaerococcus prevotii DSM 20548]SUU94144.1 Nicotinamide nucleotide repair protein [Anaerococcus prevotii]